MGREKELESLRKWLDDGRRLVTVTGPPGVGKTALLKRFCEIESQTLWVDGARAESASELRAEILRAMGLPDRAWPSIDAQGAGLVADINDRPHCTVVIDALDSLGQDAVSVLQRLLELSQQIVILCAARRRLDVSQEQIVLVAPLDRPARNATVEQVEESAAGRLFVDRARRVWPAFEIDAGNVDAVIALLHRLDGLPLAIELAAARMNLLSVADLCQELGSSNQILEGRRGAALDEIIAASWKELKPPVRDGLRSVAELPGDFDLEAARAVIADGHTAVSIVQHLVDSSLLSAVSGSGQRRFYLLESIRRFVQNQCSDASGQQIRHRMGRYFADLAADCVAQLHGARGAEALELMAREQQHLECIVNAPDRFGLSADDEIHCLLAVNMVYMLRGGPRDWPERLRRRRQALQDSDADRGLLANLRLRTTLRNQAVRDVEQMRTIVEEVRQVGREIGDRSLALRALLYGAQMKLGSLSRTWIDDATEIAESMRLEPATELRLLMCRGHVEAMEGDAEVARRLWRQALERSRAIGDRWAQAILLHLLGELNVGRDLERATSQLSQAAQRYENMQLYSNQRAALLSLVEGQVRHGQREGVEERLDRCQSLARRHGATLATVRLRLLRGEFLVDLARRDEAHQVLDEAWGRAKSCGSASLETQCALALVSSRFIDGGPKAARRDLQRFVDGFCADRDDLSPFLNARWDCVEATIFAGEGKREPGRRCLAKLDSLGAIREEGVLDCLIRCAQWHIDFEAPGMERVVAFEQLATMRAIESSNWARLALETARATLTSDEVVVLETLRQAPKESLVVAEAYQWFRDPLGEWHDLSNRNIPWRFLATVARRRWSHQGEQCGDVISDETLIDAVWPEQQLTVDAASNRVYVTVNALRNLGLDGYLERLDDGYRLDLEVIWIE